MANYNGPLEACDCRIYIVRYDMVLESIVELAAISDASSGHLRRCSDADTTNKCLSRSKDASILSWPTIMGHYKQRVELAVGGRPKLGLIKSPTTL
eukprot:scaffold7783_cov85-Skeletonema_dohrnii-CCMP3373.AAC.1